VAGSPGADPLRCRCCLTPLTRTVAGPGEAAADTWWICSACLLVQLPGAARTSSRSTSPARLPMAEGYAEDLTRKLRLGPGGFVVEVGRSSSRLLHEVAELGVQVLSLQSDPDRPATEVRAELVRLGAESGEAIRQQYRPAQLVITIGDLAQAVDLADFVLGLRAMLVDDGWLMIETPYLAKAIGRFWLRRRGLGDRQCFTLLTLQQVLELAGLTVVDVEEIDFEGGWLRVFARPEQLSGSSTEAVDRMLAAEAEAGLHTLTGHLAAFAAAGGS
jgi:hypothetical protein